MEFSSVLHQGDWNNKLWNGNRLSASDGCNLEQVWSALKALTLYPFRAWSILLRNFCAWPIDSLPWVMRFGCSFLMGQHRIVWKRSASATRNLRLLKEDLPLTHQRPGPQLTLTAMLKGAELEVMLRIECLPVMIDQVGYIWCVSFNPKMLKVRVNKG